MILSSSLFNELIGYLNHSLYATNKLEDVKCSIVIKDLRINSNHYYEVDWEALELIDNDLKFTDGTSLIYFVINNNNITNFKLIK
jgi:hypothetical protein